MDDVHAAHGAASIVEHPLLLDVPLRVDVGRVVLVQLGDDVLDDLGGVVAVGRDAALREAVQLVEPEDVELLEVLLDQVHNRRQQAEQDPDEGEDPSQAAAAATFALRRGRRGLLFGRHD